MALSSGCTIVYSLLVISFLLTLLSLFIPPCVHRLPSDAHLLGFRLPSLSLGLQHQRLHLGDCEEHEELSDTPGKVAPADCFVCVFVHLSFSRETMIFVSIGSQNVQWNDIDYMDQFMDFTYDQTKFGTLPDLVKDLHAHDQRYVMILVHGSFAFAFVCVPLLCLI